MSPNRKRHYSCTFEICSVRCRRGRAAWARACGVDMGVRCRGGACKNKICLAPRGSSHAALAGDSGARRLAGAAAPGPVLGAGRVFVVVAQRGVCRSTQRQPARVG